MFEFLRRIIRNKEQSLIPPSQTRQNIGSLAVHYFDEVCTRIERLTSSGQKEAMEADAEALKQCLLRQTGTQKSQEPFDGPCSQSCKLAIEYIEKLFALQRQLLEASRIDEAQSLRVFLDQINERSQRFSKRLDGIAAKKGRRKI
jgi:hypothetical protein